MDVEVCFQWADVDIANILSIAYLYDIVDDVYYVPIPLLLIY